MVKKLPIGIQDFPTLIRGGYQYVDKTEQIHQMLELGVTFFFSRPRRFGKSLLVSTLASLFRAEKDLFEGTWIASSNYDWTPHPVIHLDFSRLNGDTPEELHAAFREYLLQEAKCRGVELDASHSPASILSVLIQRLAAKGKVVLLVDEYDSPLVKHLADEPRTRELRRVFHGIFATVKSLQPYLRFVFITGISKFSKVSLFSGMNSLNDISLFPQLATVVGLTGEEIQTQMGSQLESLASTMDITQDELFGQLQNWYNGYRFSRVGHVARVFNPWSVLNFLQTGELQNFWFSSGTPTFLIDLVEQRDYDVLHLEQEPFVTGSELENNQDISTITIESLLYQTGYLTIDHYDNASDTYYLRLPNEEVRRSLIGCIYQRLSKLPVTQHERFLQKLRRAVESADIEAMCGHFNELLAAIPYPIDIPREGYYHSLLYMCIRTLGFRVEAEVHTNRGRIDMIVELPDQVLIFELKIDSSADEALEQIHASGYADRFQPTGKPILVVGANFNSESRSLTEWKVESLLLN